MLSLGRAGLLAAAVIAACAVAVLVIGLWRRDARYLESGRRAILAQFGLLTVASLSLVALFVTDRFDVAAVFYHSRSDQPLQYKIAGLWASAETSLLFWAWVLSGFAALVAAFPPRQARELTPHALAIMAAINGFFSFLVAFVSNPFVLLPAPQPDGWGMNPMLLNPGMLIHPTTQYLGYVGFTVPFAFAVTALLLKRTDDAWIRATRPYTLWAWLFLSVGMIYGAQWAYTELGWGGFWAWDPVENAALLPWLTGTAFLHSVMLQERRGMFKLWNVGLIAVTFLLTVFGTFITRSGVLASVHAFSDTTIGHYFLGFLAAAAGLSLYLSISRRHLLAGEHRLESPLSKESSFLLNNLLLLAMAVGVFWGTVYPLVSRAFTGQTVSLGEPFFNRVAVPVGVLLVLLMGICPLIAWRRASARNLARNFLWPLVAGVAALAALVASLGPDRFWAALALAAAVFALATVVLDVARAVAVRRQLSGDPAGPAVWRLLSGNRRRYGGYLVHVGVVFMIVGIVGGSAFVQEVEAPLEVGQSLTLRDYTVQYRGLSVEEQGRISVVHADLLVLRGGREVGTLRPAKEFHPQSENPRSEVAILGSLREDLYVILGGWEDYGRIAAFKVQLHPLMAWLWLGMYGLILGTVFAAWPQARQVARGRARSSLDAAAGGGR